MRLAENVWIARKECAICGSAAMNLERRIGDFPIDRCKDCGFLQVSRILPPEIVDAYYAAGYDGERPRQGQEVNAEINFAVMRQFGLTQCSGQTLLDIGCGYGFFLQRMRDRTGADAAGVELSDAQRLYAQEVLDLKVCQDPDALPERFNQGVDLMVCFEVIEHIAHPVDFLREYAQRLRPGGTLVVATDNFQSLPVRAMGDAFPKWIPHQHISLFEPGTLHATFEKTGLLKVTNQISVTPWELMLRAMVYRGSLRRLGGRRFDLNSELRTESSRPFLAFRARRALNRLWFQLGRHRDLRGEMMFVAARRLR